MKNIFKRAIALIFVVLMTVSFVACKSVDNLNLTADQKLEYSQNIAESVDMKSGYSFTGTLTNTEKDGDIEEYREYARTGTIEGYVFDNDGTLKGLVLYAEALITVREIQHTGVAGADGTITYNSVEDESYKGMFKVYIKDGYAYMQMSDEVALDEDLSNAEFHSDVDYLGDELYDLAESLYDFAMDRLGNDNNGGAEIMEEENNESVEAIVDALMTAKVEDVIGFTASDVADFVIKLLSDKFNLKLENRKVVAYINYDIKAIINKVLDVLSDCYNEGKSVYTTLNNIADAVKEDLNLKYEGKFVDYVLNNVESFFYDEDGNSITIADVIAKVNAFLKSKDINLTVETIINTIYDSASNFVDTALETVEAGIEEENAGEQNLTIYQQYMAEYGEMRIAELFDEDVAIDGMIDTAKGYLKTTKLDSQEIGGLLMMLYNNETKKFELNTIKELNILFELVSTKKGELESVHFKFVADTTDSKNEDVEYNGAELTLNIEKLSSKDNLKVIDTASILAEMK